MANVPNAWWWKHPVTGQWSLAKQSIVLIEVPNDGNKYWVDGLHFEDQITYKTVQVATYPASHYEPCKVTGEIKPKGLKVNAHTQQMLTELKRLEYMEKQAKAAEKWQLANGSSIQWNAIPDFKPEPPEYWSNAVKQSVSVDIESMKGAFEAWEPDIHYSGLQLLAENAKTKALTEPEPDEEDMPKPSKNDKFCILCKKLECEVCKVCETAGCKAQGYDCSTLAQAAASGLWTPRTQKMRGYFRLAAHGATPSYSLPVREASDITHENYWPGGKYFARPCPESPWHGFVESRVVTTREAAIALLKEAQAKDPMAELLLCQHIEADHNMVITPAGVTVGDGHDGATSGHQTSTVPLLGVPLTGDLAEPEFLADSGIDTSKDDPYYEVVTCNIAKYGKDHFITQVRAGAKAPRSADFVPETFTVRNIIKAEGDLIEFRDLMQDVPAGSVVCHEGGSLISHYGVHCLTHKIAIVTTHTPQIGDMLEKTEDLPKPNLEAVVRGIAAGAAHPSYSYDDFRARLKHMLMVLHNSSAQGGDAAFNIGYGAVTMMIAGMAASHGEARHHWVRPKLDRSSVHMGAFKDFFKARDMLSSTQWSFTHERWKDGYGGLAWANCTQSIFALDAALRAMVQAPTQANLTTLIDKWNFTVNQAHNGGWWLDKFITRDAFDYASVQHLNAIIDGGMYIPKVAGFRRQNKELIAEFESKWRYAGEIHLQQMEDPYWADMLKQPLVIEGDTVRYPDGRDTPELSHESDEEEGHETCDCDECNPPIVVEDPEGLLQGGEEPAEYAVESVTKPAKTKPAGTAYKVAKITDIDAMHARYEGNGLVHVQAREGNKYQSWQVQLDEPTAEAFQKAYADVASWGEYEQSYGSDVVNYVPFEFTIVKGPAVWYGEWKGWRLRIDLTESDVQPQLYALDMIPIPKPKPEEQPEPELIPEDMPF